MVLADVELRDNIINSHAEKKAKPEKQIGNPNNTNSINTEHLFERFSPFKNAFTLPPVSNVTPMDDTGIFGNAYDDEDIIRDFNSAIQTRRMTKISDEHAMMDVKSAFLYGTIEEEVYVCQPPSFEDPRFPDKVYKVEKALYGLHQAFKAWSTKKSLCDEFEASRPDITFAVSACARFQFTPKMSHLHAVKRIFRYLKGQPKLGLWYPRDSPFDLEAFSDSDYAGASLNRKSTIGEYVAATNCCGHVLWIQKSKCMIMGFQLHDQTRGFIDNESTICIVKNLVFHSKTKHIEIRHHFIRDCYEKKLIQVIKIHTDHKKWFYCRSSQKAFDVSENPVFHSKTKHIEITHHFIKDSYEKKLIQVIKIHTDHNVADLLTKAFDVSRFNFLIASIGLLNL
ncbi:putative ribonuclease H-like domain-containing protein [Tanacetum coccineum]|uniref:Ribonuclease H-like domain-containing protein n=1 Tax=Tanacetum coccineum TaxID=301880 RepID=A0ABQ5GIF6_9ASTR